MAVGESVLIEPMGVARRGTWRAVRFASLRSAAAHDKRNLSGANGQACYWFSNGCAIGCDSCDGSTRGPIPKFVLAADGRYVVCSRFLPI